MFRLSWLSANFINIKLAIYRDCQVVLEENTEFKSCFLFHEILEDTYYIHNFIKESVNE